MQAPSDHSWLGGRGFAPLSVRPAEAAGFADFLRDPMTQARLSIPTRPYLTGPQGESPAPYPKLEHLSADLPRLEARLGFSPHRLPHENRPDHGDWRAAKDAETAGIVACPAAEGIARFSHRFDPD
ncbi:hypothetical protein ACNKFW_10735 [Paracoccus sp. TD-10]|uniref:hypothetical protein n=1 Tax=Paracoccus sp. TD-10 TaxID=3395918 RepID=UPI003AACAA2C